MRYSAVIWGAGILTGCVYALSYLCFDIQVVLMKHLPRPLALGIAGLFAMGMGLGSSLACALAPASFLESEEGTRWLVEYGRTRRPWVFRLEALGIAAIIGFVTLVVLLDAFVFI
jgi:hypothetical protein